MTVFEGAADAASAAVGIDAACTPPGGPVRVA